jgi:hypothetical protein
MIMDKELNEFIDKKCCVYLDDIIIFGKTEEEHDANLELILETLEKKKFEINKTKMQYKQQKIKVL